VTIAGGAGRRGVWLEGEGSRPLPTAESGGNIDAGEARHTSGFYLVRVGLGLASVAFIASVLWPHGQELSFFSPRDPRDAVGAAGEGLGRVAQGLQGLAQGAEDVVGEALGFADRTTPTGDFRPLVSDARPPAPDSSQVPRGNGVVILVPDSDGPPPPEAGPSPTSEPQPSPTAEPTSPEPTTSPSSSPSPSPSASPSPTPTDSPTPTPTGTPSPTPSDSPPPPSPSPTETTSPAPTPTGQPSSARRPRLDRSGVRDELARRARMLRAARQAAPLGAPNRYADGMTDAPAVPEHQG